MYIVYFEHAYILYLEVSSFLCNFETCKIFFNTTLKSTLPYPVFPIPLQQLELYET